MVMKQSLAFLLALLTSATVLANAGPPRLQKGQKIIEPTVRFEGVDRYPGHVFYLNYGGFSLGSSRVEVKESAVIKLQFEAGKTNASQASLLLLAWERAEFDRRKKEDPSLKWIEERKGALTLQLPHMDRAHPETVKEVPLTTYRVALKDGKLSADKIEPKKSADAGPAGVAPIWLFALAASLSMGWFGVWVARRGKA